MSYSQLNPEERLELYRLKQTTNLSIRGIAKKMGRSHTTISRELKRNQHPELKNYLPDTAQSQAVERRQQAKLPFSKFTLNVIEEVQSGLRDYHSPEQIAGRLQRFGKPTMSHETIYQMIYQNYQGMGIYAQNLRHSHRQRQRRGQQQSKRGVIPNRVGIEERPAIAEQKTEIGHWEGDTIIGGSHLGAIATYVDKSSKFLVARVMKTRTAAELNRATEEAFAGLPACHLKTFTFDNGKEFSGHEQLAAGLGVKCYFANPYHSWERGLNEHTNGLIRQFFPKGTNFKIVKQAEVERVTELINHRPRKSLDYPTSCKVFFNQSGTSPLQT